MKQRIFFQFCLMSMLLFCGCSFFQSSKPVKTENRTQLFASIWKPSKAENAPDTVVMEFSADGVRITGCAGTNRFFGNCAWEVKDFPLPSQFSPLEFGMMGSTRMAGPHDDYEAEFLKRMSEVRAYRLSDDGKQLSLFNSRGGLLLNFDRISGVGN